jgi:hypothetical protein
MRKLQMVSKTEVKNTIKEVFLTVREVMDIDDWTYTKKNLKKRIKDMEKHILIELSGISE